MKTAQEYLDFAQANMHRMAYKRKMDVLFPNGWGAQDLADWLCRNKTGKGISELEPITSHTPGFIPQANYDVQDVTDTVESRLAQYRQIFSADTPNDEMMLRILCQNEVTIEKLNTKADTLINNGRITSKDLQDVVNMLTKLSTECRLIQKDLGIDKPSRGEGQDAGLKLMDYVQQAKKVLHKQGFPIACPSCFHSEAKIRNLYGFVVWHLQDEVEWSFTWKCPRCNAKNKFNQDIVPDLRAMFEWT